MSKRYALIAVEGNQDQAFLGKVLKEFLSFTKVPDKKICEDDLWSKFIPKYPPKSGGLYSRLDMPTILENNDWSLGIYVGEGSNLIKNLKDKFTDMENDIFSAFAIVVDADNDTPDEVAQKYTKNLQEIFPSFPNNPGQVLNGSPNLGIYILPDNHTQGVLENLILECGEIVYPEYLQKAEEYINNFPLADRTKFKWKPFDQEKAIIASVVSVLKPGKTNTTSLSDEQWVSQQTQSQLQGIIDFFNQLIV